MEKTYTEIISELLNGKITSYRIAQETGLSVQLIDKYRLGKSSIDNMTLGKAETLVKFATSLNNNRYFDGDYEVFTLEGDLNHKKQQLHEAFFDFSQSKKLSAKSFSNLTEELESLQSDTINDSEHLYLSFEAIAGEAVENDEIPTGGEPNNGKESVVRYNQIDIEPNQKVYMLLTYDV